MEVRDPDAIRVFTHEPSLRLLMLFAPRATTVSAVAQASGQSIAHVFYHASRFLECGLLSLEREERRKGRAVRHYRTAAAAFFVPADALHRPSTRGLTEELRALLDHAAAHPGFDGLTFAADDKGAVVMDGMAPSLPRQPPTAEFWHVLRLPDPVAAQLTRDLAELFARYEGAAGEGRPFLIHAALAPRGEG